MHTLHSIRATAVFFAAALSLSSLAADNTEFTTMDVSLTNVAVESVSTTNIAFGDVVASTVNPIATRTITVNATNTWPFTIAIASGLHINTNLFGILPDYGR